METCKISKVTLALILLLSYATFCDSSSSGGSSRGSTSVTFKAGACPTKLAKGLASLGASCGTLTVPEKRSNRKEGKVELPVAIIPSTRQPPEPDPVVYMNGGPGGNGIGQAQDLVNVGLNATRDLIIMNQRGECLHPAQPGVS